ncbi:MAG: NADH-quinone oxidoreductase subunit NuoE [Planctomycetes bacterium]|nr:NADH-quinone oxidoreductase subunit NuoE [Planctomycetota bacterium]
MKKPTATQIKNVLKDFEPKKGSLLIPVLQKIQETFGYVPPESLKLIGRHINVAQSKIYGVLTFYSQFSTTPRGKYIIRPCRGTACHVRGAQNIISKIKSKIKLEDGETTPDYKFTLETVACLGACALAPMVVIGKEYHGNLTPDRIDAIIDACK